MKNYHKPTINLEMIISNEPMATLNEWLQEAGNDYQDAYIITYEIMS